MAELKTDLDKLLTIIEASIDGVYNAAVIVQKKIYDLIIKEINRFEISDGRFIANQDYASRILLIEKQINDIFKSKHYAYPITEYFGTYHTIEDTAVALQKDYNQLQVDRALLTPARKSLLKQANYWLKGAGLNDAYIQPAKYLILQQVTTGASISDSLALLKKWDEGEAKGLLAAGRQTPNLQKYATQLARDTSYQYNGTINNIIRNEYKLDAFIYTGDIIKDSRPLCVHLVNMDREIKFNELPELLEKYPQGVIPGTNKKNFVVYRGGYSCRHLVYPTRSK